MLVDQCQNITVKSIANQIAKQGVDIKKVEEIGFKFEGEEYPSYVTLDRIKTMFGGERVWFLCPGCGYRKYKLFLQPDDTRYRCRKCLDLKYELQSVSHSDRYVGVRYRKACEKLQTTRGFHKARRALMDAMIWKAQHDDLWRRMSATNEKRMAETDRRLERMAKRRQKKEGSSKKTENPRWWEEDDTFLSKYLDG